MVTHCLSRVEPCFKFRWDSQKSPTISQHWTLQFSLNWHKKATYISITVGKRCSHTSAHLSSFSFTTLIRYMLVIPHFRWLYKLKGGGVHKGKGGMENHTSPLVYKSSATLHLPLLSHQNGCLQIVFHEAQGIPNSAPRYTTGSFPILTLHLTPTQIRISRRFHFKNRVLLLKEM